MSTIKLLLVDDDEFVRGALTRALNRTGTFSVISARNGEHALELLSSERIDAMLTDLQMPTMDGLTLLGALFERGIRLPVAVMTGQVIAPELARRLQGFGIAATFTKPIDVGTLADELQRALGPETVGRIRGITLFGLLQLLEVERKTALIVVRSPGNEGRLYFEDGRLADAHVRRQSGVDAAYEILGWADPTVEIFYQRRPRQQTVSEPLQHILMEAARLMDERGNSNGPAQPARPPVEDMPDTAAGFEGRWVQAALQEAMETQGAVGAALVHVPSGMTLGEAGGSSSFSMELAAAAATDLVRAELKAVNALKLDDAIEDIMITLGKQYHLISFLGVAQEAFVYLVLDRGSANLGMARHRLSRIAGRITL